VQAIDGTRRSEAASQPARDPLEVAPRELRAPQAEGLDEEDAVGSGKARHQVLLVRPQVRVPVREPETDDVAIAQVDQTAPRPVTTAGNVASRISTSRASDQPATY
jgi:hypothetical protein